MKKELYFKVKFGFGGSEKATIHEKDLEKVIAAQYLQKPVSLGSAVVSGKYIISITPDYHKYTGWNESYEPKDADDFSQIKRDCPDFNGVIDKYQERVKYLINQNQVHLIGTGVEISGLIESQRKGTTSVQELLDKNV